MTNYVFKAGNKDLAPLLLLHSTGGDEQQLLAIADQIAPAHPILSIRGRINQQGSNRYFKLHGMGGFTKENFDLDSLNEESNWLANEIQRLAKKHEIKLQNMIALGYSNGANVALNMLLKKICPFDKVIAFHGMQLETIPQPHQVGQAKVFLSYAKNDPIIPENEFALLKADLTRFGCQVDSFETTSGHQLTQEEVLAAKNWLDKTP
ncbi:alpha/beta hydrolase [Lactococcus paracarnosus]|uniref:Alpha/beta hydrolase n=1 Tax=Pseudolactococcus paracarnosus TaxID=2749962 RepID=A0ABT0ALW3_9LACT|nr:alpha/beta hydrolase [Lactococcus paracarnosus]MCJ1977493.1 alpha/beta hydrolase [Lactococcus paracarnosus]MCJ1983636.1 alpha/beta hydrolase [Lactococcus paracarnosus]MCJ1997748.1 alpha/beta hydrolase [Lactococcus paracarnosus]